MSPKTFETPSTMSRATTPIISNCSVVDPATKRHLQNTSSTLEDRTKSLAFRDYMSDEVNNDTLLADAEESITRTKQNLSAKLSPQSDSSKSGHSDKSHSNTISGSLSNHSLDSFLQSYTSEDNYSFQEIIDNASAKLKEKFAVLYKEEERSRERLAKILQLPPIEQQLMLTNNDEERTRMRPIETWKYENKNSIMYIPDGVELSEEEQRKMSARKQTIQHHATRLTVNPFGPGDAQANQNKYNTQSGNSTPLSEQQHPQRSPAETSTLRPYGVGGSSFRLVATPSPCPGEAFSPLMTWGEIEGTPFRLDGLDTPLVHHSFGGGSDGRPGSSASTSSSFRINATPRREVIAHELAERIGEKMRAQKQKAMDVARRNINGGVGIDSSMASSPLTPSNRGSRRERLASLSPAAQRLATKKLGVRMTPIECKSPLILTPNRTTPRAGLNNFAKLKVAIGKRKEDIRDGSCSPMINTLVSRGQSAKTVEKTSQIQQKTEALISPTTTLTDDLLKIPNQRLRASDFF